MNQAHADDVHLNLDAIAETLQQGGEVLQGHKKVGAVTVAVNAYPVSLPETMLQGAEAIREYKRTKKAHEDAKKGLDDAKGRTKLLAAVMAALFGLASAMVSQSSGWASQNLDLAYALLVGGLLAVVIAVGIAVGIGLIDPTKGEFTPKGA